MTKSNISKADKEDIISFTRRNMELEGIVIKIRENSVIVYIMSKDFNSNDLDIDNNLTVVAHSNYKVISKHKQTVVSA